MVTDPLRAIIFDPDGARYVNREPGREIHLSACRCIAEVRGVMLAQAELLVKETKNRLSADLGYRVSLTRTNNNLGLTDRILRLIGIEGMFRSCLVRMAHPAYT